MIHAGFPSFFGLGLGDGHVPTFSCFYFSWAQVPCRGAARRRALQANYVSCPCALRVLQMQCRMSFSCFKILSLPFLVVPHLEAQRSYNQTITVLITQL